MTPRVERHLAEHAAGVGYRRAAASLGEFGTTLSHTEVGRRLVRLHEEMHSELFGPDAIVDAPQASPPNRADVLLIEPDGSRLAPQRRPIRRAPDLRLSDQRGRRPAEDREDAARGPRLEGEQGRRRRPSAPG